MERLSQIDEDSGSDIESLAPVVIGNGSGHPGVTSHKWKVFKPE